jgi:hypothetical protein
VGHRNPGGYRGAHLFFPIRYDRKHFIPVQFGVNIRYCFDKLRKSRLFGFTFKVQLYRLGIKNIM